MTHKTPHKEKGKKAHLKLLDLFFFAKGENIVHDHLRLDERYTFKGDYLKFT